MASANLNSNLTLLDLVQRLDPNGAYARIVEMLTLNTPLLEDMVWKEGNLTTGHRVTSRTALPSVTWRRINEGIKSTKSGVGQADETCGILSGRSNVDVKLAELNGNAPAFRASEDLGFMQAFRKELETGLFYHSLKANPERFTGLSPRFSATTDPAGKQIILHDGAAGGNDQSSIWLVGWGDKSVYGIFPKGTKAGLDHKDMGEQYVDDGTGNSQTFRAYSTDWQWQVGLCVEDWRYVVRIANVDNSNLAATGRALIVSMIRAIEEKMYDLTSVRPVFYMNRFVSSFLRQQALDTSQHQLTIETVGGKRILMLGEVPIRRSDGLTSTEAILS